MPGELTQITDPLGNITTLAYNPVGLIASITDAQNKRKRGIQESPVKKLCARM